MKPGRVEDADTLFDHHDGLFRLTYILMIDNIDSTMSRMVTIVITVKSLALNAMRWF